MNCENVRSDDIPERYVAGRLPGTDRDAYEAHYFECDACFAELEAMRAVQTDLRASAPAIRALPPARKVSVMRFAVPLAMAAAILFAAVLYRGRNQATPAVPVAVSPKSADYTLLATLEPPAYEPALRRGSADKAAERFVQAMENYRRHDYAQTIAGLQASLALDSKAAAPRFFLGACELLTGDWDQGTRDLETVVASGSGPFLEEGLMLLAKASLHRNDPATARRDLEQLVAGKGDLATAAGELLRQMDGLSSGQGK